MHRVVVSVPVLFNCGGCRIRGYQRRRNNPDQRRDDAKTEHKNNAPQRPVLPRVPLGILIGGAVLRRQAPNMLQQTNRPSKPSTPEKRSNYQEPVHASSIVVPKTTRETANVSQPPHDARCHSSASASAFPMMLFMSGLNCGPQ